MENKNKLRMVKYLCQWQKEENEDASLSSFSSKFKRISAVFDKVDELSNNTTLDSVSSVKLEEQPKKVRRITSRGKKVVETSDESDMEILSDKDDDDEVVVQSRRRTPRTTSKARKSYREPELSSEDSFVDDDDDDVDSNESFVDE